MNKNKDVEGMPSLERLLYLMEHKKVILENLERLGKAGGRAVWQEQNVPKCTGVEIKTDYGAHCLISTYYDEDLVSRIVAVSIEYYQDRLKTIDMLIGLAERVVQKEVGPQLLGILTNMHVGKE